MKFEYYDYINMDEYRHYLNQKVTDSLCKHVCRNVNSKTEALVRASEMIGYYGVWWGYGQGLHKFQERNRLVNIGRIQSFIYDRMARPVRLVIDREGEIWVDNLHSAIAHVLCRGTNITLGLMPVYIVDMSDSVPKIIDGNRVIEFDRDKIAGLLATSSNRCNRVSRDIKAVGYTIGEFMEDNEITRDAITLQVADYHNFIKETEKKILLVSGH